MRHLSEKLASFLADKRIRFIGLCAVLSLLWACYPASEVTYSNPQETTINQWLIEFRTSEGKLQLSLRYRRQNDRGSFSFNDTQFGITLDQLAGLTREQMMSSTGSNVRFN